jgi:hypothetical protein
MTMVDQKVVFAERVKRIQTGKQYEHEDVIGFRTQKLYEKRFGEKAKRPKRTFREKLMVPVAFAAGLSSVLLGRLAYFHMAKIEGLPEAFYDLGSRGMVIFGVIIAGLMVVLLSLATKGRLQALLLGALAMHYGEAAMASNAQALWTEMFSAEYAAEMAEKGQSYRVAAVR